MRRIQILFSCLCYLIAFSAVAEESEHEIIEDPFDYYDGAVARIKAFLPDAQFHSVESITKKWSFCSLQIWKFIFIDKTLREEAEVYSYDRDESVEGGPITCKRVFDFTISSFRRSFPSESLITADNVYEHMKFNLAEYKRQINESAPGYQMSHLEVGFYSSDGHLLLRSSGKANNEDAYVDIDMTTGEIEIFGPLPPIGGVPPIPQPASR